MDKQLDELRNKLNGASFAEKLELKQQIHDLEVQMGRKSCNINNHEECLSCGS